jgi:hypothetical protein
MKLIDPELRKWWCREDMIGEYDNMPLDAIAKRKCEEYPYRGRL